MDYRELDVVTVARLLKEQRPYEGTERVARPPRLGDVGTIMCVLSQDHYTVECVDESGFTVWLADFQGTELSPSTAPTKATSKSKLRRDGKHCPLCLSPLEKNAPLTRLQRECLACGAHPSLDELCCRCRANAIWESKTGAACQTCGLVGAKTAVILQQS